MVPRTVMTNQKTHNSAPANYNKSHIYCNYKQFSLHTIFFKYQFDILAFI